jgi:hypothetical protein
MTKPFFTYRHDWAYHSPATATILDASYDGGTQQWIERKHDDFVEIRGAITETISPDSYYQAHTTQNYRIEEFNEPTKSTVNIYDTYYQVSMGYDKHERGLYEYLGTFLCVCLCLGVGVCVCACVF